MKNSIHGITIEYAIGPFIHSTDNEPLVDFTSGIFAAGLGMCNGQIAKKIVSQAFNCMHSYQFETPIRKQYLQRLCEFTGFESAYMFSSGTEATEAAWKIARMVRGKDGVLGLEHAFHGKTLGAQIMAGTVPDYRYADRARAGCLIFEPYVAKTAKFHPKQQIEKILQLVEDLNLILIADEIQAGFYRTGHLFGYQHYPDLHPDIVCIGKQMTNGFPSSAILGPAEWLENDYYELSSTNGGNPLACAAGLGVIEQMEAPGFLDNLRQLENIFWSNLVNLKQPVEGKGLVASVWFDSVKQADRAVVDLARAGLLVVHTKSNTIKLAPNLNCSLETLDLGLRILGEVLTNG
jgi:acetylornithine/succinyldiaminopimelate/putrescine aminotransferase